MWSQCYGAIRSANSFMENYSAEALERFQWNDKYEEDIEKSQHVSGKNYAGAPCFLLL